MKVRSPSLLSRSKWGKMTLCITCHTNTKNDGGLAVGNKQTQGSLSQPVAGSDTRPVSKSRVTNRVNLFPSCSKQAVDALVGVIYQVQLTLLFMVASKENRYQATSSYLIVVCMYSRSRTALQNSARFWGRTIVPEITKLQSCIA